MPDHDTVTIYGTCQTEGCRNEGQPIRATVPAPPATATIQCGVCGNPITQTADTKPEQPTEIPEWLK